MNYCVYCGSALLDPTRCDGCGAVKLGSTWHQSSPSSDRPEATTTGWRPDPTGRHEGRYFVAGQPTDLIRDGTTEGLDLIGKQELEQANATQRQPTPRRPTSPRRRRIWLAISAVVLVVTLTGATVAAVLYVNRDKETVDDKYLEALEDAGLSSVFNSDANAVAKGKQVCRQLDDGGPPQGMPADRIAVEQYCPQFVQGFHILETTAVKGTFTLKDDSPSTYSPSITISGSSCSGSGGYGDIDHGTPVTVKNGKGDIVTTTYLEEGEGGRYQCVFPFSFDVTEGQDRYVVSVGRRGELSYSFAELKANRVELVLH
jgi:hypothetical protein